MKIIINGSEEDVAAGTDLLSLLHQLSLDPATVVVECDKVIVNPEEYASTTVHEGAVLEIIRFVGGG